MTATDQPVHPADVFDLIVGTSLSSIVSFMLVHGKEGKEMPLKNVIDLFKEELGNMLKRVEEGAPVPKYSLEGLDAVLARFFEPRKSLSMKEKGLPTPKCGAAAMVRQFTKEDKDKNANQTMLLDTLNPKVSHNVSEVLRASASHPLYFDYPVEMNDKFFVDGAVGESNALAFAIPRLKELHPERQLGSAVSITAASGEESGAQKTLARHSPEYFHQMVTFFPYVFKANDLKYKSAHGKHGQEGKFTRLQPRSPETLSGFQVRETDVAKMVAAVRGEFTDVKSPYLGDVLAAAAEVAAATAREDEFTEEHLKLVKRIAEEARQTSLG